MMNTAQAKGFDTGDRVKLRSFLSIRRGGSRKTYHFRPGEEFVVICPIVKDLFYAVSLSHPLLGVFEMTEDSFVQA